MGSQPQEERSLSRRRAQHLVRPGTGHLQEGHLQKEGRLWDRVQAVHHLMGKGLPLGLVAHHLGREHRPQREGVRPDTEHCPQQEEGVHLGREHYLQQEAVHPGRVHFPQQMAYQHQVDLGMVDYEVPVRGKPSPLRQLQQTLFHRREQEEEHLHPVRKERTQ